MEELEQDGSQAESPDGSPKQDLEPKEGQGGGQILVGGDIAPGGIAGPGEVNAENIAGHNVVRADTYVEDGATLIQQTQGWRPPSIDPEDVEANYLCWQLHTASRIPLGQLAPVTPNSNGTTPEITLDAIYVELDTEMAGKVTDDKDGIRPSRPVLGAVIEAPRLVILGDPGSGKTTFVNFLTLCLAGERLYPDLGFLKRLHLRPAIGRRKVVEWPHGTLLPVRVVLREFAQDLPKDAKRGTAAMLWDYIKSELAAHGLSKYAQHLECALRKGNCLVMLDGLDEVPETAHRTLVRDAVQDFADTYGKSRFLVTCRVLSYNNKDWKLANFPSVKLSSLTPTQIESFIMAWYDALARLGYVTARQARSKTRQLQNAAAEILDLAQNPMLLTVMAVVHAFQGELPRERARLFEECATLLLWRWQKGKYSESIIEALETREERLYKGLCEVAYRAHQLQGNGKAESADIPQSEVLDVLQPYLDDDWGRAQQFCEYVEERAGLLVGKGHGKDGKRQFAFPHRSFQEFLAGSFLASSWGFERRATELVQEGDRWREVMLLAVGHMVFNQRDVTRPLNAIHFLCPEEAPEDEHGWRAVWWAAEMLLLVGRRVAEQDDFIGRAAAERVMKRLVTLVAEGHLTPRERAKAADVLGQLGDPRRGVISSEPDMIAIPGGAYKGVKLAPFRIARYPVTNAQFLDFARDDGYGKQDYWTKAGWTWRQKAGNNIGGLLADPAWGVANRPVVGITWHEAVAYVRWLAGTTGKPYRLLAEAEWERAAAGPDGKRAYPWGDEWRDGVANTKEADVNHSTAVGIFPGDKTPDGAYDMGGNVWEWCCSQYVEGNKSLGGEDDLAASGPRILRGGAFESTKRIARCTNSHWHEPDIRTNLVGFRVALTGKP
jgi:formylglycine-generating enzyme required for sulfatase activity